MSKSNTTLIWLTFLGMVGIYIAGYYGYQKYQSYKAGTSSVGGAANLLSGLLGSTN
jgi:hypothetical protein